MDIILCGVILVLIFAVLVMAMKIYLMRKSAHEICGKLTDNGSCETNTLLDISSRDKYMTSLAVSLNNQLRSLRDARHRFMSGDAELKNAVTNISHDLRTPLTAIFGYLDMLESGELTEEQRRYAEIIRNRAEMMSSLTEELFDYSLCVADSQKIETVYVNVNDILEESIAAFYTLLSEKNITPLISMTDKSIIRIAERESLARVFSNLLNNAVRYSKGDLEIILSDDGVISFANTVNEISATDVGKLFDRFYTVNSARSSTGLGLSIAKTLVRKMGGVISARLEGKRLIIEVVLSE